MEALLSRIPIIQGPAVHHCSVEILTLRLVLKGLGRVIFAFHYKYHEQNPFLCSLQQELRSACSCSLSAKERKEYIWAHRIHFEQPSFFVG
jgi:hypothetical protein